MKQLITTPTFLALAVLLSTPATHAQSTRTWVSSTGSDLNSCSRNAPCQSFAGALAKTFAGGEISVVDSGGYGPVTITKAITINGDGTLASILALGTDGVVVNAGASDKVVLRNISIRGGGTGNDGVRLIVGGQVNLENVSISGFTGRGINYQMSQGTFSQLFVTDTHITNGATGIFVSSTSGSALAMLDNVHLDGLTVGLEVSANGAAIVSDSVISGNTNGVLASASTALISLDHCQSAFNGFAVNASVAGAAIHLANNQISKNFTGISIAAGATVSSVGNNRVFANISGSTLPNGVTPLQ